MRVAVVGSGYMGGGIAQMLAVAGHDVAIADVSPEIARANGERLITEAEAFEREGFFPPGSADRIRTIRPADSVEDAVEDAQFVEEAVFELVAVKHEALARISAAAPPDAVLGSNTSTISIATLAEAVQRPERFLGVHYSNPAPFIPGVELIPHAGTAPEAVDTAEEVVRSTGKITARVKDVTGFVLNRLQYALLSESIRLVEEGVASAEDVDTIARTTFGFRLPFFGPFGIADMAGLDVYRMCYQQLSEAHGERYATPALLEQIVDSGRLGTKSGGGFLAEPDQDVAALVEYRTRAYGRLARLLADLGPSPLAG
jgi:3-hydroxybutyryl-CoA dehydrogenase